MKFYFLLLLLPLVFLSSCDSNKKAVLENRSANDNVLITVSGTKKISFDPWKIELKVKAYNFKEDHLSFEVYAKNIDSNSVHFIWQDNNNCQIVFQQSDNTARKFHLTASSEQLKLEEI